MVDFKKRLVFISVLSIIPITLSILALGCDMQIKKKEGETEVSSNLADFLTEDATIQQDFSESMPTEAETGIDISHSHGSISVKGWDRDEVKIEGKKIVKARDEETAQMYAKQMRVEIKSEGGSIIVKTIRPRPEESWKIRQITINYELYAPEGMNVALENIHGDVLVEAFAGKLELNSRHGKLQVAQIGKDASVKHEHGDVDISHVSGNAWVSKRHGNLRIESVDGELRLDHQHGNVELDTIEKGADLTKQHGEVNVANVGGMLKIDHEHGRLRLKMIEGDVEIKKQHGEIDIESVNGNVSVHSEHGNLRVIDIGGNVHLTGAHGNAHVENVSGIADISREHSKVSLHNVETANPL
jgi:hypothetical protein